MLDGCGVSRQVLTEEKAAVYEQLAQINKRIWQERKKIEMCREIAKSAPVLQSDIRYEQRRTSSEIQHEHFSEDTRSGAYRTG